LGSHLDTPRRGYLHLGIYVGARKVVHYAGLAQPLRRGPVEEVPFAHFARVTARLGAIAPESKSGTNSASAGKTEPPDLGSHLNQDADD
jgi:hypothetical protein